MSTDVVCLCDACPDCINAETDGLWICYYDQYRTAINVLLDAECANNSLLPLLNMIELWVKVIGLNFGMGSDNAVTAEMFTGHKLSQLIEKLRDSIRWDEYKQVEEELLDVWDIVDYLAGLSAEEDISLPEAMRYPQTRRKKFSLNQCMVAYLAELCDTFAVDEVISKVKELMEKTYSIYNQIYEMRVLQNRFY